MNKTKLSLVGIVVVVLVLAVLALIPMVTIEVPSSAEHTFELNESMPRVRKILVRTNAVKKIVAMADAELLNQKWLQMEFTIERPILRQDWHLDGTGELIVRTNDAYIGRHDIMLIQSIDVTPERLHVSNDLAHPAGPIREYASTLTLTPGVDGKASITTTLNLKIKTKVSWLTRKTVEQRIRESARAASQKQEQAIRNVVQQHADELIILPELDMT